MSKKECLYSYSSSSFDNAFGCASNTMIDLELVDNRQDGGCQTVTLSISGRQNTDSFASFTINGVDKKQLKLLSKIFADAAKKAKH